MVDPEVQSATLIVTSRFHVKPERRESVIEAALKLANACLQEPGCVEYRVSTDAADPSAIFLYEAWADAYSMTNCFQMTPMCEFKETLKKIKAAEPEVKRYRVA